MDATNSDLLVINSISTRFGHLYAHHQEFLLRSTAYSCLSCCSGCDAGELGGKMCAVPNMSVFCSSLTSWFPGMSLTYFLNDLEMVPFAPIITGITLIIIIIIIFILDFTVNFLMKLATTSIPTLYLSCH